MGVNVIDSPEAGGPHGKGRIEVTGPNTVAVTITNKENETKTYSLEFTQGVSMTMIGDWQLQPADDIYIKLSTDLLDIEYVRPRNGTFYVEFDGFEQYESDLPNISWDEGKTWEGKPWLPERYLAHSLYRVVAGGPFSGMTIRDDFTYEFEYDQNLGTWNLTGSKRFKYHEKVLAVLNVFGFDLQHDNLLYEGETYEVENRPNITNVLPQLNTKMIPAVKGEGRLGSVQVKDGWVVDSTLTTGPYGMTGNTLQAAMDNAAAANTQATEQREANLSEFEDRAAQVLEDSATGEIS